MSGDRPYSCDDHGVSVYIPNYYARCSPYTFFVYGSTICGRELVAKRHSDGITVFTSRDILSGWYGGINR